MDASDATTTTAPPPPPPPDGTAKCLTRSSRDKVIAGVAGGLGNYFSIDPVIFRIGFIALAFAGGSGLALYFLAWLLLPDDAGGQAPVHGLTKGPTHPAQVPVILIIGGLVVLAMLDDHSHGLFDGAFLPLVLIGIGLYLWVWKPSFSTKAPTTDPAAAPAPGPAPAASYATATETPSATTGEVPYATTTVEPPFATTWSPLPDPGPPVPAGPRVHRITGSVISLLLVVGGAAALLHTTGAFDVSVEMVLATLLTITGLALLATAWIGRARGLIAVAILLAGALGLAAAIDVPVSGGIGERAWRPTSADELSATYRLGVGEAVLDLRDLELAASSEHNVEATVAIGHLIILVPPSIATTIDTHAGIGETVVFGLRDEGRGARARLGDVEPLPPDIVEGGAGRDDVLVPRPRIFIDARVGLGQVEVRRVAA